jgi:hypothetical protein
MVPPVSFEVDLKVHDAREQLLVKLAVSGWATVVVVVVDLGTEVVVVVVVDLGTEVVVVVVVDLGTEVVVVVVVDLGTEVVVVVGGGGVPEMDDSLENGPVPAPFTAWTS